MRYLFTVVCFFLVITVTAVNALAQASPAPTYTLYADGEYALGVNCIGGELRLWQRSGEAGGILFCEPPGTPEPTVTPMQTAVPLIGTYKTYYFPVMIGGTE